VAVLVQGVTWPIVSIRDLHSRAQVHHLWQFHVSDEANAFSRNLMFLCQSMQIPGWDFVRDTYNVGGVERYSLGNVKRGGLLSADFIEVEGGLVEKFFRDWLDQVEVRDPAAIADLKYRASMSKYSRAARAVRYNRDHTSGIVHEFVTLLPVKMGEPRRTAVSGPALIQVEMSCDEVRRVYGD